MPDTCHRSHLTDQDRNAPSKEIREALFSQNENINLSWGYPRLKAMKFRTDLFSLKNVFIFVAPFISGITILREKKGKVPMESHMKPGSKQLLGKRAVIYLRTATPNEKEISRQEEACKKLIGQHNSTIIATIKEDGISGNADISMRPGLAQALEIFETKMAEVLVIYRLDRLSRDPNQLFNLLDRLLRANVRVVTVTEGDIFTQPRYLGL